MASADHLKNCSPPRPAPNGKNLIFAVVVKTKDVTATQVRFGEATLLVRCDMRRRKPSSLPHAFICSGLVQVGYTFACLQAIKRGDVRPEVIRDTIFRNDLLDWFEPQWSHYTAEGKIDQAGELYRNFLGDLEATTPADIACSENLQWCYLNTGGVVWRVESAAQARELMRQTPRQSGRSI